MVKFYPSLSTELSDWCMSQPLFYIASAPRYGSHINISPKGLPSTTFSILGPNTAVYIDATGSGAETIAHLYENGRCTIMFCSFDKSPRILRLFCKGRVVEFWDEEFGSLTRQMGMEVPVGARAVIVLDIFKVQTSCGYGVPLLSETDQQKGLLDRETLGHWAGKTVSDNKMVDYRAKNNAYSLDDLPGLKAGRRTRGEWLWTGDARAYLTRLWNQMDAMVIGFVFAFLFIDVLFLFNIRINGVFADWRR
ncbi:pyridoxamine phosphate oxidase family protein [Aureobasidium pullulans]|nr:pyridoxamine phosphate oxidase family protein [Aureobasidium pullulans]